MADFRIMTPHLELVAGTATFSQAELNDRSRFAALLEARVPEDWPPPLNDEASMTWYANFLAENPEGVGWGLWYFVRRQPGQERLLLGNGGFKGMPAPDGTVEIGYSIIPAHQRHGYASEAVRGLLAWAWRHATVRRVLAETFPDLTPSIRVLEKAGFTHIGPGSEPGIICFELPRPLATSA